MFDLIARFVEPGAKLLRAWALTGGVSAETTALEIATPGGGVRRMVVRRHEPAKLRKRPHLAREEFELLKALHSGGMPVPQPLHVDETGEILSTPYLVLAYVEGEQQFSPPDVPAMADRLAAILVRIHKTEGVEETLRFLPRQGSGLSRRPEVLDDSLSEGQVREAMEALWPLPQCNPSVLLHGDFWPGNVLWQDDVLAAIIDWEHARLGDPLYDLAESRLEILWAFGLNAMHRFTQSYLASMPSVDCTHLPYWDLCAALRPAGDLSEWGLDPAKEHDMRVRHRWFVTQALERAQTLLG